MVRFIDRETEMAFLEERYASGKFEFLVLYGRRRVGKTELLRAFLEGRSHIYFLADKRGTDRNVLRLRREMAEALDVHEVATEELEELFRWYVGEAGDRPLVVIDEFPYLVEKDDSIPSVLQLIIDQNLSGTSSMLVLCGSSEGMMERSVLDARSPLYGRRTGHWRVMPLAFADACRFFPGASIERCIEFHSILGGVPHYLQRFSDEAGAVENAEREVMSRTGGLYEEVDFLLREELREPDVYKAILEAIGAGRAKAGQIANASRIPAHDIDKYLKVLARLGVVERARPVTEGPRSKRTRYFLADPLFRFWFTFCEPHKSDLELGKTGRCRQVVEDRLNAFVGRAFEPLCRELIASAFPGRWSEMGTWWGAMRENGKRVEVEIDVVGLNAADKEILLGECKWSQGVDAGSVLSNLRAKADHVDWNRGKRREVYVLFARSFRRRPDEPDVLVYDIDDIRGMVENKV
ncbi:MAG: ATP-binding protein [Thermoplasmata archaeon]|nr:ATP-binding protein [Thermoplasmata archaeon]